ncbi:MAG: SpoIIIAH-like family protein [Oscillospiraceae bacterium]|nr:SpoIIIAH-like family protein [Oscillospiraceae bacterium]
MNNWKKNLIAAAVLVVVCAGIYMNWMFTNDKTVDNLTDVLDSEKVMAEDGLLLEVGGMGEDTISDYFAAVRLSRQQARDSAVELLQEAMAYGEGADVQVSGEKLEEIVQTALCEAQIESLVIAKGYADCVAYMSDNGISVAVASPENGMEQTDVAVIADIVITQAGLDYEDIRVVEVQ